MDTRISVAGGQVVNARPMGVGATSAVYLVKDTSDPDQELYAMKVCKKSILRCVLYGVSCHA